MENSISPAIDQTLCNACHIQVSTEDTFCNNCGYPLKGSEDEQRNFMAQLTSNEFDLQEYHNAIKTARYRLYVVAAIFALWAVIAGTRISTDPGETVEAIVDLIICGLFVGLGAWSSKKPVAALVSGAVLYGIVLILMLIGSPEAFFKGIIFKIVVVASLVTGIQAALKAEKIKKETHLR